MGTFPLSLDGVASLLGTLRGRGTLEKFKEFEDMSLDRSSRVSVAARVLGVAVACCLAASLGAWFAVSPALARAQRSMGSVSTTLRLVASDDCAAPGPAGVGARVLAATGVGVGVLLCVMAALALGGFALARSGHGARVVSLRVAGAVLAVAMLASSFVLATGDAHATEANLPNVTLKAQAEAMLGAGGKPTVPVLTLSNGSGHDLTIEKVTVSDDVTWQSLLVGRTVKAGDSATAGWTKTHLPKALADRLCAAKHKELTVTVDYSYKTDSMPVPPGPDPSPFPKPLPVPGVYRALFLIGEHGTSIIGQVEFDVKSGDKLGAAGVMAPTVTPEDGYTFTGWKYSESGETYQPEGLLDLTMPDHNVMFTAQYQPGVSVTVEFDYAEGVDEDGRKSKKLTGPKGSGYTAPTNLRRDNYRFAGWDPTPTGVFDGTTTKYTARWERMSYTVTWNGNGGQFPDAGETHHETVGLGEPANGPRVDPTQTHTVFMGWNTAADGTGDEVKPGQKRPSGDATYYAQWMSYWISVRDLPDPSPSKHEPHKTQKDIDKDMDAISSGNQSIMDEYTKLMYEDKYHLYTKIGHGSHVNDYLEARFIHIGNHDNDGSNATLQGVHSLPQAYPMNATNTNHGGWRDSWLRRRMNPGMGDGDIWNNLSSGMRSRVKKVNKRTRLGNRGANAFMTYDSLWILSYREFTGVSQYRHEPYSLTEGSQYMYWAANIRNANGINVTLPPTMAWTRFDDKPTGSDAESWWQRSPYSGNSLSFMAVDPDGYLNSHRYAGTHLSVVPAFCF